ncbi:MULTISPECIES: hypothetical protein [Nocardia]|uniref:hypothetical protein n=1 Tax=Nocardia TaxID=1817 RepID=UPI000D6887D4|nr:MULTISPECIES: hypothetical protein [Nocardia]
MTPDEVLILLQVAQSYDSRNIDRLMQTAWLDAANRMRWERDAALEAIRSHYAVSTDRIMPAHVTALIRTMRPVSFAPQYRPALSAAPPASEGGRSAARALFASAARTQEPRNRPLPRRRRTELLPDGVEVGPEPQKALRGDLGRIVRQPQSGRRGED